MKSSTSCPSSSRKYSATARPGTRGLVHLAVHERRLGATRGALARVLDHAPLHHLVVQVVALAGALADAGEHRVAAVLQRDVVDQLHDDHRLADARAAEEPDLTTL